MRPWLVVLVLAVAVPVGVRWFTWPASESHVLDQTSVQAGHRLFHHQWKPNDPLARGGDGLGPVFNERSCIACHNQGGAGGGGPVGKNVTMFTVASAGGTGAARQGVIHAQSVRFPPDTLAHIDPSLPRTSRPRLEEIVFSPGSPTSVLIFPSGVSITQRNTPALFGSRLIDELPDAVIVAQERKQRLKWGMAPANNDRFPVGRVSRLPDGRIGRFGWKAQTASLADFVQAACANELGLSNPGQEQPAPLSNESYQPPGIDLTDEQCRQLTTFVASLPQPVEIVPRDPDERALAQQGKRLFAVIGCADCHVPDLGPIQGIYSDLLLHLMGRDLQAMGAYYGPPKGVPVPIPSPGQLPDPREWRTPPLWGVADSAPYLHDGRADTLEEAIRLHGGQAQAANNRFNQLHADEQKAVITFLKTLRAPQAAPTTE